MARGPIQTVSVSITGAGNQTIVAAVAGQRAVLVSYMIVGSAAQTINLQNDAGTVTLGVLTTAAATVLSFQGEVYAPAVQSAIGDGIRINITAGNITGHCCYYMSTG